jgi:hypothetical protein
VKDIVPCLGDFEALELQQHISEEMISEHLQLLQRMMKTLPHHSAPVHGI